MGALLKTVAAIVLLVGLAPVVAILGPARAPAGLPPPNSVVDIHTHVVGIGLGSDCDGCFVSPAIRDGYKFVWYLRAFGTTEEELHERGDGVVAEQLVERIRASRFVASAVVLALDGVVGADGELDREATQVYVPNDYVYALARRYPEFHAGPSINPYRGDALERLDRVRSSGGVLVKWIPSIMGIDPADERLRPFYRRMVALGLPLLVHVGDENAFMQADNRLGDPVRLRLPLELGVTVIAAHLATTGENGGEANFTRLLGMFERYPNLLSEISSLTQVNKLGYLSQALERSELHPRLMHGSDWPLQFFPLVWAGWHVGKAPIAELRYAASLDNPLDRDIALKAALGTPAAVFPRAGEVLGIH
ncbi:MAG: amidohydrolase family protein [Gammaproteobacteria bacterium]